MSQTITLPARPKPRNRLAVLARQRCAGTHRTATKTQRQRAQRALRDALAAPPGAA